MRHDRPPPPGGNPYLTWPAPAAPERAGECLAIGAAVLAVGGLGHARAAGADPGAVTRAAFVLALAGLVAFGGLQLGLLAAGGDRLVSVLAFAAYAVPGALSALPLTLVARRRFPLATAGGGWR